MDKVHHLEPAARRLKEAANGPLKADPSTDDLMIKEIKLFMTTSKCIINIISLFCLLDGCLRLVIICE